MADIFVSYDTRDSGLAHRLGDALTALGHSAHLYEDEVRPGESFVKWMRQRLGKAKHCACVYTSNYLSSPYTELEFDMALQQTLTAPGFLLVFRFEDCEAPEVARQFPRCDLFGAADEKEFRARIARYLGSGSARPAASSPVPVEREEPRSASEKRPPSLRVGIAEGLAAVAGLATVWGTLQSDLPVPARWSAFAALAILLLFGVHFYAVLHGTGEPRGSRGWREFGKLRASLVRGGAFEVVYAGFLTRALDALDKFLGDPPAGAATKPTLAQCWSTAAYDRCLLLALLYPLATMFVVWVATGHAGDAERAIWFAESSTGEIGERFGALALSLALAIGYLRFSRGEGLMLRRIWWLVFPGFVAGSVVSRSVDVNAGGGEIAAAIVGFAALAGTAIAAFYGAGAFALGISVAFAFAVALVSGFADAGLVVLVIASAIGLGILGAFLFVGLVFLVWLKEKNRLGYGLVAFTIFVFAACVAAARYLSLSIGWDRSGTLLVFFGLLTLVNAPFDWAAIGLTRYLLRYGLALKGWWPIALAVVDAATAAVSVALLAIACVLAVQLFGDVAAHFGGGEKARIIHLAQVFASLAEAPTASENLWIWFMLFSTAIPSVVNVFIACGAALRSLPFVNRWLIAELLAGADMSEPAKIRVALVLAGQWALGALATFWLVYGLFIVVGPLVGPAYAHWLLDLSQSVAACNWPARAIIWLTGGGWQGCM